MIIHVGTRNKIKVQAVEEVLSEYPEIFSRDRVVVLADVTSDVSDQPLSLKETTDGAINRANNAFNKNTECSIGMESGLMQAPGTKSGYLNFTVVAVKTVDDLYIGHSTGFDLPPKMIESLLLHGKELDEAAYMSGLADVPNVGKVDGGLLGILTKSKVSRKDYLKQALRMALVPLQNKGLYSEDS
jgi:inosine/xanthosine triphosphatase